MKTEGRLTRCALKGLLGDTVFAVLCGCGHNIRKILAHLRALLAASGITTSASSMSTLKFKRYFEPKIGYDPYIEGNFPILLMISASYSYALFNLG